MWFLFIINLTGGVLYKKMRQNLTKNIFNSLKTIQLKKSLFYQPIIIKKKPARCLSYDQLLTDKNYTTHRDTVDFGSINKVSVFQLPVLLHSHRACWDSTD